MLNCSIVLRPNPNFRDSSLHQIFNFGIRISGKSESIFQFWDFCESFNKNLAFFNKTWHFRLPNVKIFSHFSTKPRKIFAKSCESLANPGSESWKKDSNQSQIMKRDSNPGSRIRFGLNTNAVGCCYHTLLACPPFSSHVVNRRQSAEILI